jgi:gas vesicle protein
MLRNIAGFMRGFIVGMAVAGAAAVLLAPASGEETQASLQHRLQAAKAAYEEGRRNTEQELMAYFEEAKRPESTPRSAGL